MRYRFPALSDSGSTRPRNAAAVCEPSTKADRAGGPSATSLPPPSPPSGPKSSPQSAAAIRSRLCSMTSTEWPASTRRWLGRAKRTESPDKKYSVNHLVIICQRTALQEHQKVLSSLCYVV
jgi:hypothetical protein